MEAVDSGWDGSRMPAEVKQNLSKSLASSSIGVTGVKSEQRNAGKTEPYEAQDAYLVVLQLRAFAKQRVWVDGRPAPVAPFKSGAVAIYPLNRLWIADLHDAYDSLQFYLPMSEVACVAEELTGKASKELWLPQHLNEQDQTVNQIGQLLLPALARPDEAPNLFIDHVALALRAHLVHRYGNQSIRRERSAGRLAGWQERRVKDLLLSNLAEDVSLEELAKHCRLSRGHFVKVFRATTGMPPHQWLIAQRVERAKELMMSTDMPLTEIAFQCGFSDQSHFSRLFSRAVGVTPRTWRMSFRSCE